MQAIVSGIGLQETVSTHAQKNLGGEWILAWPTERTTYKILLAELIALYTHLVRTNGLSIVETVGNIFVERWGHLKRSNGQVARSIRRK